MPVNSCQLSTGYHAAAPSTAPQRTTDPQVDLLNVRPILRPTIPPPDLSQAIDRDLSAQPTIRLNLDRDMGKPVDVLEIDSHATVDRVEKTKKCSAR